MAKVEPLTTARVLRGPFDYELPEGAGVGSVVEVPFGRQTLLGVVTGLAETSEHTLVAPRRVLEHSLPPDLVELVGHASSLGMYTNLVTSAIGLSRPRAQALREAGFQPPPGG